MNSPNLGLFDINPIILAAGASKQVSTSDWSVEWLLISVVSGVMDVYFGVNSNPTGVPLFRVTANSPPLWLPVVFTGDRYILTMLATGIDPLQGTVVFCAKHNRGFDYTR